MLESENVVGDGVSSRHADMPVLYGAMQDGRTLAGFNGRRAAMSIGALLVACFFLVLSSDRVQELPAVLLGGDGEANSRPAESITRLFTDEYIKPFLWKTMPQLDAVWVFLEDGRQVLLSLPCRLQVCTCNGKQILSLITVSWRFRLTRGSLSTSDLAEPKSRMRHDA